MKKIYSCCICHKVLEDKPIRLTKEEYGAGKYNQYSPVANYDFCKECYKKFDNWIKKHKDKKELEYSP